MHEFFSVDKGNHDKFLIFSSLHIIVLVTICAVILSMIIFRNYLKQKSGFYRYVIAGIAAVLQISYLVWLIQVGKWTIRTGLPLELCEMTLIFCIIMLIGKSYRLFEVTYFWGFMGSSLALLFPNLHVSYHHFTFWVFMLTHALNIVALVFMISIEKYQPTRKSIWVSFMITNIYMLFITTINHFGGSNYYFYYIFSNPAPNIPNPIMYANSWFLKILMLEGVTLSALFICYLPVIVVNVFKGKFTDKPQKGYPCTENQILPGNGIYKNPKTRTS